MTAKEAFHLVQEKHKDARITQFIDFDDSSFVLTVIEKGEEDKINAPYIRVNKSTGALSSFLPTLHLKEWVKAVQNRRIEVSTLA